MNAFIRFAAPAAALVLLLTAARADSAQEITAADTAYNALAAKEGMLNASLAYAAPDAVYPQFVAAHLQGAAAVHKAFDGLPAGTVLTWHVETVTAATSRDLGYTIGAYTYRQPLPGKPDLVQTGHYCTIWKKQPDGSWKFVLDTGEEDKPA